MHFATTGCQRANMNRTSRLQAVGDAVSSVMCYFDGAAQEVLQAKTWGAWKDLKMQQQRRENTLMAMGVKGAGSQAIFLTRILHEFHKAVLSSRREISARSKVMRTANSVGGALLCMFQESTEAYLMKVTFVAWTRDIHSAQVMQDVFLAFRNRSESLDQILVAQVVHSWHKTVSLRRHGKKMLDTSAKTADQIVDRMLQMWMIPEEDVLMTWTMNSWKQAGTRRRKLLNAFTVLDVTGRTTTLQHLHHWNTTTKKLSASRREAKHLVYNQELKVGHLAKMDEAMQTVMGYFDEADTALVLSKTMVAWKHEVKETRELVGALLAFQGREDSLQMLLVTQTIHEMHKAAMNARRSKGHRSQVLESVSGAVESVLTYFTSAQEEVVLAKTCGAWRAAARARRLVMRVLLAFRMKAETSKMETLLVTFAIRDWSKSCASKKQKTARLSNLDAAMQAACAYFNDAAKSMCLSTSMAAWKSQCSESRRLSDVLLSFQTKGEALSKVLVSQSMHSWHKAVARDQQARRGTMQTMDAMEDALQMTFGYFEGARDFGAMSSTLAGWKHRLMDSSRLAQTLLSFQNQGEAMQQVLVSQAVHSWHKAVEKAQSTRNGLESLDDAMRVTLSYFHVAGDDAARAMTFAAWKHNVWDMRKLRAVLLSFQNRNTGMLQVLITQIVHSWHKASVKDQHKRVAAQQKLESMHSALSAICSYFSEADSQMALSTTMASWKHVANDTRRLKEALVAFGSKTKSLLTVLLTQVVHVWHKGVVHAEQTRHKLQSVDGALAAALSYFKEAGNDIALSSTFVSWKQAWLDRRRIAEVLASFENRGEALQTALLMEVIHSWRHAGWRDKHKRAEAASIMVGKDVASDVMKAAFSYFSVAHTGLCMSTTFAAWKHQTLVELQIAMVLISFETKSAASDQIFSTQVIHGWHKAVQIAGMTRYKMESMNDAMQATLSYFEESDNDVALGKTFAGWKHEVVQVRRFSEVLLSFHSNVDAMNQVLLTQAIHSWHKAVEASELSRKKKLEGVSDAIQVTLGYFEDASKDVVLASSLAAWKHEVAKVLRLAQVLMTFHSKGEALCQLLVTQAIHSWHKAVEGAQLSRNKMESVTDAMATALSYFEGARDDVKLGISFARWRAQYVETSRLTDSLLAFREKGDAMEQVLLAQVVHVWHKAIVLSQMTSNKMESVDSAMATALSYFEEASRDVALGRSFAAWKHEVTETQCLTQALLSFKARGEALDHILVHQVVHTWRTTVQVVERARQKLESVGDVMQASLSYFAEANRDVALGRTFASWKHQVLHVRQLTEVLLSFQSKGDAMDTLLVTQTVHSWHKAVQASTA